MSELNSTSIFMHEIKNCLSNVYSLVEIIEADPKELQTCLPLIKASIKQIKNIEYDYDEYRKSGKNAIRISHVNLATVITSLAEEYRIQAEEKKITIKTDCKNIKVQTDVTKLRQVLANLITNAIKYNVTGGKILIECKQVADKIRVYISDTGIGMSQEEIVKLGTMFYRSKKIDVPGTGLGWSLIKSIIGIMGWDINIRSKNKPSHMFEYTTTIALFL